MANLIITVIAIALVAIASLMGAYYGGSAFLNNQSAANASTVLNQAQQISGAWNAYLSDNLNTPPNSISQLVTSGYLAQIPTPPTPSGVTSPSLFIASATATINGASSTHYFVEMNVGSKNTTTITDPAFAACFRIIKTAIGPTAAGQLTAIPSSQSWGTIFNGATGNGTFGCGVWSGNGSYTLLPGYLNGTNNSGAFYMEYLLQ